DSGFCREHLLRWCEANGVDYLFGLAKNNRVLALLGPALQRAQAQYAQTGQAARVFHDFSYATLQTWSRLRRVVGKAEHLAGGPNPRFVVTSLSAAALAAEALYEWRYCGRGEMENRIKEQQLELFASRVSCATLRANQIRLCLATVAYVVLRALRQFGLRQTALAQAQAGTIRTKLLKIGAQVRVSVRRVDVALASGCQYQGGFVRAWQALRELVRISPAP